MDVVEDPDYDKNLSEPAMMENMPPAATTSFEGSNAVPKPNHNFLTGASMTVSNM